MLLLAGTLLVEQELTISGDFKQHLYFNDIASKQRFMYIVLGEIPCKVRLIYPTALSILFLALTISY